MTRSRSRAVWFMLVAVMWASPAFGHPLIEQARERFMSADFAGALDVLGEAENADDLSRDDVIELLELRAIVNDAIDNDDAVTRDLRALASLDPGHSFSPEASPILVEQFGGISAQPMTVGVDVAQVGHDVSIDATVENDPGGLVRSVVILGRSTTRGLWQRSEVSSLTLEDASAEAVEWSVEVIGPGQAHLMERSNRRDVASEGGGDGSSEPRQFDEDAFGSDRDDSRSTRRRWPIWLGVGVGSAVVIGIIVGVVVGTRGNDDLTQVEGPFVGED